VGKGCGICAVSAPEGQRANIATLQEIGTKINEKFGDEKTRFVQGEAGFVSTQRFISYASAQAGSAHSL